MPQIAEVFAKIGPTSPAAAQQNDDKFAAKEPQGDCDLSPGGKSIRMRRKGRNQLGKQKARELRRRFCADLKKLRPGVLRDDVDQPFDKFLFVRRSPIY